MSFRAAALASLLVVGAYACGTVDRGQDVQFAEITYDENFFYCKVEPMILQQKCGSGDPAQGDGENGCHFSIARFPLRDHKPVPCKGIVPDVGSVPSEAQGNYQSAQREMTPDPDLAPLVNRPTKVFLHPRQIFDPESPQADLIREWATKNTSQ